MVADLRNLQGTDQRVNAFASALTSWTFFYMTPDDQGSTSPNTAMGGGKQFITAMNGAQTPAAPRSPWTYAGNSRSDRLGGWAYSSQIYLVSDLSWLTGIAGIGPAYADWIAGCTLPDASVGIAFGFTGTTSTCGLGYFSLSFWTPALLDVQLVRGMVINEFFRTDAAPYVAGDNKFRNCFAPTSGAPGDGEDGLGATIGVCRAVEISSAEFVGGSSSTIPEPATGVLSVMGAMAVFGLRSMRSKGRS